jgi:prepilin-type N-terminal cleavage/methylation domain-containing protein
MTISSRPIERPVRGGFTLVELLTVLAVIAILLAILVPAVGVVRRQAAKSKTLGQLTQYATACEAFRAELGFYPSMGATGSEFALAGHNAVFIETLSGFSAEGQAPTTAYARRANPRRLRFHTFGESEFAPPASDHAGQIVDSFGNPHLHVVFDRDLNGVIEADEFEALPSERRPDHPLRGGVFGYVANAEENPDWFWILSW